MGRRSSKSIKTSFKHAIKKSGIGYAPDAKREWLKKTCMQLGMLAADFDHAEALLAR